MTGTVLPPPYPWSQTTKDPKLNTATTSWSSGSPTPTADSDDPDVGIPCVPFCHLCLWCSPPPPPSDWSTAGGGGGGGSDDGSNNDNNNNNGNEECSTREAQICSTVCVVGSGCEFDCSTATGCSVTASATTTVGTPALTVAITLDQWPQATDEPGAEVTSVPPDLPASLSDVQFVVFLQKPVDSLDEWTWSGYLLPTYYDEADVCNNAYEVVTSTKNLPDRIHMDTDYGYPMYLGLFEAQDLNCGYVPEGLTPGDVHCGTQVVTCLELDALNALGYPGYTCEDTKLYMQAWCPMA